MKILKKRQILLLHSALIAESGGSDGIRDEGLLDSAVNTPFQTFSGQDLSPTRRAMGTGSMTLSGNDFPSRINPIT